MLQAWTQYTRFFFAIIRALFLPVDRFQRLLTFSMQLVQPRKRHEEARFVERPQQHCETLCFVSLQNRLTASSTAVVSSADYCHGAELREKPTQLMRHEPKHATVALDLLLLL